MNNITVSRAKILEEVVSHYSLNKRSIDYDEEGEWGLSSYSGLKCKFKTEGNPIGRLLDKSLSAKLDVEEVPLIDIWNGLPQNIKELGFSFWVQISVLHDNCEYWEDGSLSESGLEFINYIRENYCENDNNLEIEII